MLCRTVALDLHVEMDPARVTVRARPIAFRGIWLADSGQQLGSYRLRRSERPRLPAVQVILERVVEEPCVLGNLNHHEGRSRLYSRRVM
jgi:hypothetical protein